MKRVLFLIFCLSFLLLARDNPFKPVVSSKTLGKATNVSDGYKPLDIEKFKLPSSTRVIKDVTFKVLNVDGTISKLKYKIDKKVDWHNGISIANRAIQKVARPTKKKKKIKPKELKLFKFLTILIDKNRLFIKSEDKLLREMYFARPYKIALDFQRNVAFYTKIKRLKLPPFKRVIIGNHGKFYRVVLVLDGDYRYKIKKDTNGYLVELF